MRDLHKTINSILMDLFGSDQVLELSQELWQKIELFDQEHHQFQKTIQPGTQLNESDCFLIVYPDQFQADSASPLQALESFLLTYVGDVVKGLHILPFFPASSDDGFAVIDYHSVAPEFGTWQDIARLEKNYQLMFDLVINHVSSKSAWFRKFLQGDPAYRDYFIVIGPNTDLASVVRPRPTPLLTTFQTAGGMKQVWTTFSTDQIDLNYSNPKVLLEMIDVLLEYAGHGARIIRLDAIAYVWKKIGSTCIHLPQAHAIVKLLRAILDACAPSVLLLTETNVPQKENFSYFGENVSGLNRSDEAQMVYQFPLAPLILHTFISGNAIRLSTWVKSLPVLPPGATFFNFTASHDGIGLRPAEGLLDAEEIKDLLRRAEAHAGTISYGSNPDGGWIPYELNISWYDALNDPSKPDEQVDIRRFLASQAIMLSLAGVPGIYIHSLLGSRNCQPCMKESGRARSINREKFRLEQLQEQLADKHGRRRAILEGSRRLLDLRRQQPGFHPAAGQQILDLDPAIFGLQRIAGDGTYLICLTNVTDGERQIQLQLSDWHLPAGGTWHDLLSDERIRSSNQLQVRLAPYQTRWLKSE